MKKNYYLCIMDYRKYIIKSLDNIDTVKNFIDWSLKGFTYKSIEINDYVVLIDTLLTIEEINDEFSGLDVIVIDITEINHFDVLNDFTIETNIKIAEAKKELDISDDINYFLDLIKTRGNEYLLSGKEQQRLYELTKKVKP